MGLSHKLEISSGKTEESQLASRHPRLGAISVRDGKAQAAQHSMSTLKMGTSEAQITEHQCMRTNEPAEWQPHRKNYTRLRSVDEAQPLRDRRHETCYLTIR